MKRWPRTCPQQTVEESGSIKNSNSIKNTLIDPVLLKVLPTGVGVYLIPFTDIYGRIILQVPIVFTGSNRNRTEVFSQELFSQDSFEEEVELSDHQNSEQAVNVSLNLVQHKLVSSSTLPGVELWCVQGPILIIIGLLCRFELRAENLKRRAPKPSQAGNQKD